MKKLFYILFLALFSMACGQKKKTVAPAPVITAEMAEMSNDPKVIASFLKANPDHPKAETLKIKLIGMMTPKEDLAAKPKVEILTPEKLEKQVEKDMKDGVNDKNKQTAAVLTHLLNENPNAKQAYLQIVNRSKCNLILKISGKKFYNLDVKANTQNYIMIDKGSYKFTTKICDAQYSKTKSITNNLSLALDAR